MRNSLLIALAVALLPTGAAMAQDASATPAPAAAAATGDAAAGKTVFTICAACHSVGPGAANRIGPELNGLIGRPAGSVAGYRYSAAMKGSGLTWDVATFEKYIADPKGVVPGNKMSYGGLQDPTQVANLTAYLGTFNADGSPKS